jgi:hypothetical protein
MGANMKHSRFFLAFLLAATLAALAFVWVTKAPNGTSSGPSVALAGSNESSRDAVLAAYKQLEKSEQTGDGALYVSMQSKRKLDEAGEQAVQELGKGFPPDPSVHYELVDVRIRKDRAAVLAKITRSSSTTPQYYLGEFVLENGSWKIGQAELSQEPIETSALEAAVPPTDGAFTRAGSPWNQVPYAVANTKWFKPEQIDWRLQATEDESFLYIRFEAKASLPAPGTEIPADDAKAFKGMPAAPDGMVIKTASGKEFHLVPGANPMTRATFDSTGHATSNRYFVQYSFSIENAGQDTLFSNSTKDSFNPLIVVQDRFFDVKLPLSALGTGPANSGMEIRERNSLAKVLPYQVIRFLQ